MLPRILPLLRRHLLGVLAIFLALGGVSWAAVGLPKNSVGTKELRTGAVRSQDLRNGAVKWRDLDRNAVTSGKVTDNSLTGADINELSLTLPDTALELTGLAGGDLTGEFPNPSIANGAVTAAKVANDALGGADINEAGLDSSVLQFRVNGTCGAGEAIRTVAANGTVGCEPIVGGSPSGPAGGDLTGTFPNPTIATGAISGGVGGEILDDTLTGADIFDNALSGADVNEAGLDTTVLQARVTGTCAAGAAVASIAQVGTVACNSFPTELPPSGSAGGDLTGTYPNPTITGNAVGAAEITDLTRSVGLPLSGFLNCSDVVANEGAINFTSAVDSAPDFESAAASLMPLVWDVTVASLDTDAVCATLVVPADYASGGTVRLMSTGGAAQDNDWEVTTVRQTAGSAEDTTPATATGGTNCDSGVTAGNAYVCATTVTDTLAAGDSIVVSVRRAGGTDAMRLHGVEFRYTATQ